MRTDTSFVSQFKTQVSVHKNLYDFVIDIEVNRNVSAGSRERIHFESQLFAEFIECQCFLHHMPGGSTALSKIPAVFELTESHNLRSEAGVDLRRSRGYFLSGSKSPGNFKTILHSSAFFPSLAALAFWISSMVRRVRPVISSKVVTARPSS